MTKSDDRTEGARSVYPEYGLQTEMDDTKSYYQLIKKKYNFREKIEAQPNYESKGKFG